MKVKTNYQCKHQKSEKGVLLISQVAVERNQVYDNPHKIPIIARQFQSGQWSMIGVYPVVLDEHGLFFNFSLNSSNLDGVFFRKCTRKGFI